VAVQVELSHFSVTREGLPESEDGNATRRKLVREEARNAGFVCVCHMPVGWRFVFNIG
jgi:hypothetical protein